MSFLRWAVVTVPAILLLGFLAGGGVASPSNAAWYLAIRKPAVTPPAWVFPVAWTALYILIGLALAMILNARGARGRGMAIGLFAVQLACNIAWTPLFFGAHRLGAATIDAVLLVAFAIAATIAMGRIRPFAAWLMVPYLVWISFAAVLTWRIDQLNPGAETLVPRAATSQVIG